MIAVPVKPEYGPSLGRLLSPRWRAASAMQRVASVAVGIALVSVIAATVLTLENASFSHGGRLPFSFSYRGLYKVAPDPGGFTKVQRRSPAGLLEDSFAVESLRLPAYSGSLTAELPLYAATYIREVRQRYPDFVLRGEGKTRVTTVPGYDVFYTTSVDGRSMYGRDVLLLPEAQGSREGVAIVMLAATPQVPSPLEVASTGILSRPLKTFTFG